MGNMVDAATFPSSALPEMTSQVTQGVMKNRKFGRFLSNDHQEMLCNMLH